MPESSFKAVLDTWKGGKVTIVNPQSFRRGALTDAIDLETFEADVETVGEDFVKVKYDAKKKGEMASVEQYIPFAQIRRLSTWGSENMIHI